MSRVFVEGNLRLEFGERWRIIRYDADDSWYRRGIERQLDGTKAVDFVGLYGLRQFFFIEVTDPRGHPIIFKKTTRGSGIEFETLSKVRDTIAGLVGAVRTDRESADWRTFHSTLVSPHSVVKIVLWYEPHALGPADIRSKRKKVQLDTLTKDLKRRARWLTREVLAVCSETYGNVPPELTVTSLAGAGPKSS